MKFSDYQFSSATQACPTLCDPMDCSTPGLPVCHLEPAQTHVHQVGDAIKPSHPLSVSSSHLQSFPASGSFPIVSSLHQAAKVLKFQLWHQSFNEYSGLISFRMNWLDLLAVQETLKNLRQHHTSKASILQHSAFFTFLYLSHPYTTTGKTIALTRWTFVGKVMSLPFNMLCRLVIAFLPRRKSLLISRLQSPSAVF